MITRIFSRTAILVLLAFTSLRAAPDDTDLRLAIILTRHGVRTPLQSNEVLNRLSAQPWPDWGLPPGELTPHGYRQMVLLGKYYRDRYVAAGLITGKSDADLAVMYFDADNDARTIASAKALAEGLVPGTHPAIRSLPAGQVDALYRPAQVPVGHPDRELAAAAVRGEVGGDGANLDRAYATALADLREVLYGPSRTPPAGKDLDLMQPTRVVPGTGDGTAQMTGAFNAASRVVEAMLLSYAEGRPMSDVGWGRVSPEKLTEFIGIQTAKFRLNSGTFTPAQIQGSNLASHLLDTLDQATSGAARRGAFGSPNTRLMIIAGHDTNIVNLAGMLGLHWTVAGTQDNTPLPGGALVFELRRHRGNGQFEVSVLYVAQTLEQTRNLEALSLEHPPALAPTFIPECSTAEPGYPAPLEKFEAVMRRVIDPAFVAPLNN
ncbi:MAG TPA: histidine-type phosphatase [Candidatus Didemnitutus sp.]|nr:histidine-type phosphatase [Candidatus Didemnitutus sp.]